jgi:hypothetical protein
LRMLGGPFVDQQIAQFTSALHMSARNTFSPKKS